MSLVGHSHKPAGPRLALVRAHAGDETIVVRLRAGDRTAIAALFDRHAEAIERVLHRVLGLDAEIPDLLQDVFVHAMQGASRYKGELGSVLPWLVQIAVRSARKHIRRRTTRRWLGLTDTDELPDVPAAIDPEQQAALARVYRVLDRMPARERIPFALRFVDGMQLVEVADACELSLATAKRRLAKARARFTAMAGRDAILSAWIEEGER